MEREFDSYLKFNRRSIDDRLINELIGICRGVLADGFVTDQEAQFVCQWMESNRDITSNAMIVRLYERLAEMLIDNRLDAEEQGELLELVLSFVGGAPAPDEKPGATTLPLTSPPPEVHFNNTTFCFTGTFSFGTRSDCEAAVIQRGASAGSLTKRTNYLVIGSYATDSWKHSSFGRKIEKAAQMREDGAPIAIISEQHWSSHLL